MFGWANVVQLWTNECRLVCVKIRIWKCYPHSAHSQRSIHLREMFSSAIRDTITIVGHLYSITYRSQELSFGLFLIMKQVAVEISRQVQLLLLGGSSLAGATNQYADSFNLIIYLQSFHKTSSKQGKERNKIYVCLRIQKFF